MSAIPKYARRYCEMGKAITPLVGKVPFLMAWNADANLIRDPDVAFSYFTENPQYNIGECLEPSGDVSLDLDYLDGARQILAPEKIDVDALMLETPTIIGRGARLEFKAPAIPLSRKSVSWPPRAPGEKPVTVLELRAGRVQDVLPPSIHPDTKLPYRWLTAPRNGFPPLPDALLSIWLDFEAFRRRARNLCPWADPEPEPPPPRPQPPRPRTGPSVIAAFNEAHDVVAILEAHGYQRSGKQRWKSPHGHNLAGVILLRDGKKIRCYHSSDPLGDERAHDAFDLYARLEHGGDVRAAVRAAAQALGFDKGHAA